MERPDRELIKDHNGVIIGEVTTATDAEDDFEVWRRERLRYPARRRRILMGRCESIEAGRAMLLTYAATGPGPRRK